MTNARTAASKILRHRIELEDFEGDWTGFPIAPGAIPNYIGINLCAVEAIRWARHADDGQLVEFAIEFLPSRGGVGPVPDGDGVERRDTLEDDECIGDDLLFDEPVRPNDRLRRFRVELEGFPDGDLLPLSVLALPEMGIHVRHVEAMRWTRLAEDNQLVELALEFRPYVGGYGDPARLQEIFAREEALHHRPPLGRFLANRVRELRIAGAAASYKARRAVQRFLEGSP